MVTQTCQEFHAIDIQLASATRKFYQIFSGLSTPAVKFFSSNRTKNPFRKGANRRETLSDPKPGGQKFVKNDGLASKNGSPGSLQTAQKVASTNMRSRRNSPVSLRFPNPEVFRGRNFFAPKTGIFPISRSGARKAKKRKIRTFPRFSKGRTGGADSGVRETDPKICLLQSVLKSAKI